MSKAVLYYTAPIHLPINFIHPLCVSILHFKAKLPRGRRHSGLSGKGEGGHDMQSYSGSGKAEATPKTAV